MTTTLEIRTPEGVVFALPLAGPTTRASAMAIDLVVIILVSWLLSTLAMLVAVISPGWAVALPALLFFVVKVLYGMVLEGFWRGQTLGKKVMGLRVVDDRGLTLQPGQVVVRNLLRLFDSLPLFYLVGGVSMVLTRHCQRLGDLAAGTVVVRELTVREPRLDGVLAGQYNSFRQHPLIEARLRQQSTPEVAGLALGALLRRDDLEPAARLRVYAQLADYFRSLAAFPAETNVGLSDEQYLRNVVETVFRKRGT